MDSQASRHTAQTISSEVNSSEVISSIPALAAALRQTHHRAKPQSTTRLLFLDPAASFYQFDAKTPAAEARAAGHLVGEIAERLRRLTDAYGEWDHFEPAAFFDLTDLQAEHLVQVVERVSTVHVSFQVDAFLPSFQRSEQFWADTFYPAYHANAHASRLPTSSSTNLPINHGKGRDMERTATHGLEPIEPIESAHLPMIEQWNTLLQVARQTRNLLIQHIGYLAVNGSQEERARWRDAWAEPPARGIAADLCPSLQTVPTLTLSMEFPLPAYRQPGRKKRLRIQERTMQKR